MMFYAANFYHNISAEKMDKTGKKKIIFDRWEVHKNFSRIILKWILKIYVVRVWIWFKQLGIEFNGEIIWTW
jgi:hypothetical protein